MEDVVSYELAVKLKEKGYDDGCYSYYENKVLRWSTSPWFETQYNNDLPHITAAPTISQVLKWLRDQEISVEPISDPYNGGLEVLC